MVDFTSLRLYSPAHAFIRFHLPEDQVTLAPQEWLAWQVIDALSNAQAAYYAAHGVYAAEPGLLALPAWFPPLPLVLEGYETSIALSSGTGQFVDDPHAAYDRVNISMSPTCHHLRGFGLNRARITSLYGSTGLSFLGMQEVPGAPADATAFSPFSDAPDGYRSHALLQATFVQAEPRPAPCHAPQRPALILSPCDRLSLPLYLWKNFSGALPALTFYLQEEAIQTTTPLAVSLLQAVPHATSIRRTFMYGPGIVNSEYRVYSLHIPDGQPAGCYRLLAATGPLEDELTTVWPGDPFVIAGECKSMLIRYRSRESQSDFIYRDHNGVELRQGWNQLRLPVLLKDYAPTHDRRTYVRSDGVGVKLQERLGKTYTLETDYLPEPLHEALAIALAHDYVEFYDTMHKEWQPFLLTGDYTIDWPDNLHPVAKATAQLAHARYDTNNPYV
ncbi:MAG: hypothetical protein KF690_11255 [Bacteroidetes bacterium]|nr:hypothetical protein [Bacteroidota bacterium]